MRVIAGNLGGRVFDSPNTSRTHPMSDKMRGALFNILGDIEGLCVLDAFAGTGALAFEAVSRGAASAIALEVDRTAQQTIARNIHMLDLENQVQLIKTSASSWLAASAETNIFDIVLCDPPYHDLQLALLARLGKCVKSGGLLVISFPANTEPPIFKGFAQIGRRTYGDAQLIFYRQD